MKLSILLTGILLAAVVAAAQTPATPPRPAAPAGNVDTGKKLYLSTGCWQCHGFEGQGGAAGARLSGRLPPLPAFTGYIRKPANQMPAYTEKVLPNADVAHIHAYLQSLPAPPPVASIPLLK